MGTHDRGAFGALLQELTDRGGRSAKFTVDLHASGEDQERWQVQAMLRDHQLKSASGRTGEEALRRLVEALRT